MFGSALGALSYVSSGSWQLFRMTSGERPTPVGPGARQLQLFCSALSLPVASSIDSFGFEHMHAEEGLGAALLVKSVLHGCLLVSATGFLRASTHDGLCVDLYIGIECGVRGS